MDAKLKRAGLDAPFYSIFGEWAGPGIQKGVTLTPPPPKPLLPHSMYVTLRFHKSEVSIGKIEYCIFAVFAIKAGENLIVDPTEISQLLDPSG